MKIFLLSFLIFSAVFSSTIEEYEAEKRVDELLLLMQKRLSLMHEVAKVKWNKQLPIEDKTREEAILHAISNKSNSNPWISAFFIAQMEAAKEMQRADFFCWKNEGLIETDTNLSQESSLRAYINRLNDEIFDLLSKVTEEEFAKYRLNRPISIRESDAIPLNIWNKAISPPR